MSDLYSLAEILDELNSRWDPNPWQIPPVRALFYEGKKDIGTQCGRSSGKTDMLGYSFWRYANEHPNAENYIFEPLQNQAREILWASNRIQSFGPQELIKSINNTEMRITFHNGSFIKLDGSDNVDKLRGIKPKGLIAYDELKDHKKEFIDAMEPNRARYNAPAFYTGTPPEKHNHFVDIMDMIKIDQGGHYSHATSFDNKHNDVNFLLKKKRQLEAAGLVDIWLREYMAQYVKGGNKSVFPMVHKMPIVPLDEAWPKDSNKWTLFVCFDPASTSVFAVEFFLYNSFSRKVISVGEIYESRPEFCSARKIRDAVEEKLEEFRKRGIKDVEMYYDSAAAWFRNEISEIDEKWWLNPCDKSGGLQGEVSCWRGVLSHGHFTFTDATPKLRWEMENYYLDDKGRMPDKDDHAWQAGAYGLKAMGFDFNEVLEPKKPQKEETRYYKIEDEFHQPDSYNEID